MAKFFSKILGKKCRKNILSILKKKNKPQRNLDSTKVSPNIFHKYNLAFKLFLTEIISLKYGVNVSTEYMRKGLVDIDLEGVSMRKKKAIKRRTYETNGQFDMFHIDGNYELKRFGFVIR